VAGLRTHFGLNKNANRHGATAVGGPVAPYSTHLQGRPPQVFPKLGQTGMPNQSPTMQASRLMQNVSSEEDIEYWMGDPEDPEDVGATFNPPYNITNYYADYGNPDEQVYGENMEQLEELFGNDPKKKLSKLAAMNMKLSNMSREVLQTALIHKKFKEKITAERGKLSPRTQRHIEVNEDKALNLWKPFSDAVKKALAEIQTYKEDFQQFPNYEMLLSSFLNLQDKANTALTYIRGATRMSPIGAESLLRRTIKAIFENSLGEFEEINDEEMDEISAVGGGAMGNPGQPSGQITGHIGPLGSDNQSPHIKKNKKKKNIRNNK